MIRSPSSPCLALVGPFLLLPETGIPFNYGFPSTDMHFMIFMNRMCYIYGLHPLCGCVWVTRQTGCLLAGTSWNQINSCAQNLSQHGVQLCWTGSVPGIVYAHPLKGLIGPSNTTEPSLMFLLPPELFLLWQVKILAMKKVSLLLSLFLQTPLHIAAKC